MKKIIVLVLLTSSSVAMATTVGDIANSITDTQIMDVTKLMSAFAYIAGIGLAIKGILKLKESNESRGQVKPIIAIFLLVGSALLMSLPTFVNRGIEMLGLNNAAQTVEAKGGTGQSGGRGMLMF